jgi:hypothetical protein
VSAIAFIGFEGIIFNNISRNEVLTPKSGALCNVILTPIPGSKISVKTIPIVTAKIVVMLYDLVLENFGLVPGWVEASHTGSVDYTSGVLLTNIYILWRRHLFLNLEGNRTSLSLYKTAAYWRRNLVQKFIALCEQVKNLLDL